MATKSPVEVLDKVFSYLTDPKDVAHTRLSHCAFAKAGLRYLTTTVYLSAFNYDLNRLMEISQHFRVGPTIEKLVCDDNAFVSIVQPIAGMGSAPPIDGGFPNGNEYKKRDPARLEWYLGTCHQESRMRANAVQTARLMSAVPNLPNLKRSPSPTAVVGSQFLVTWTSHVAGSTRHSITGRVNGLLTPLIPRCGD